MSHLLFSKVREWSESESLIVDQLLNFRNSSDVDLRILNTTATTTTMNGHKVGINVSNGNNNNNGYATHKPFRVAIVGGAIGGLSTALLIGHFCRTAASPADPVDGGSSSSSPVVTIDVYEQASEYREIGAGVGFGLNAAKLMHTIPGLGAQLNDINGDRGNAWFTFVRYDNGREITYVDGPVSAEAVVRPLSIARSEYLDVLLGMIRERDVAKLHTRKKFVSVKVCTSTYVSFPEGKERERDRLRTATGCCC